MSDSRSGGHIRVPWARSERLVPRVVLRPLHEFLASSTAGGLMLFGAVIVALAWANSPWRGAYRSLIGTTVSIGIGDAGVAGDLSFWVNEGLMAFFFLVVGLEVKRELTSGELGTPRAALLPVVVALSGMAVPALLYLAIVGGGDAAKGWGIPMATDVAFALGVLALSASRTAGGLKPLLLGIAIVDDIGSVLVVALFYSGDLAWGWLAGCAGIALGVAALSRIHVRAAPVYAVLGVGLWYALFRTGVHPALAGVAMGLLTPSVPFQRPWAVSQEAHRTADETVDHPEPPDVDAHHWLRLAELSREAVSPLTRVEHVLLPWTNLAVLPLFALVNLGVDLSGVPVAITGIVFWAIVVARVVGKFVGIWGAGALAVRSGLATLPSGVGLRHLAGMAVTAGAGFTVSVFVAVLALGRDSPLLPDVKIALLFASAVSGAMGWILIRRTEAADAASTDG